MADVDRSNNNFHMAQFCKAFPINRSSKLLLTLTHAFSSNHMLGLFPIRIFCFGLLRKQIILSDKYFIKIFQWMSVCVYLMFEVLALSIYWLSYWELILVKILNHTCNKLCPAKTKTMLGLTCLLMKIVIVKYKYCIWWHRHNVCFIANTAMRSKNSVK